MNTPHAQPPYFRNDVVVDKCGAAHRVLRIDIDGQLSTAWLIDIESRTATPFPLRLPKLQDEYRRFEPAAKPDPVALPRPPSAASLRLSDKAYARIAPLLDHPDIVDPSKRHALLVARAQEGAGTPKTLLNHLRRWWQNGQTRDALLGRYIYSGRPTTAIQELVEVAQASTKVKSVKEVTSDPGADPATATFTSGRGRRNKKGGNSYQLRPADIQNMHSILESYFLEKGRFRTLTATLNELHRTAYSYVDGNGQKCLLPSSECPSLRQLDYLLKKTYPSIAVSTRRKGEKRAALEDRATTGSIQLECHGAGHIYEFDATIVDVVLVSSVDRSVLVGKPTMYLIIDRHSRLIVGYYVGFENASYPAAMQAILSIGEDKAAICKRLEIAYDAADWPAQGVLPELFLADQGELMHRQARQIARSLRSTIRNVPGLRPDWKPLVECGFKMLHQVIAPDTPAYSPDAETKQRRSAKREREAALTIEEFTKLITLAIIAHNNSPQVGYPLTYAQAADGVRPIPRELWQHSVISRMGVLDRMNYQQLRAELIPRDTATVTRNGIAFEGLHYSCPEADARGWMANGRVSRHRVEIAFDYRLVDEIIVFSPTRSGESYLAAPGQRRSTL